MDHQGDLRTSDVQSMFVVVYHGEACAPNTLLLNDDTFAAHVDLFASTRPEHITEVWLLWTSTDR